MGGMGLATVRNVARQARTTTQRDALLELAEDLRNRLGEIDVFAVAAEERLHRVPWRVDREHRRDLNRLGYYLGQLVETVDRALDDSDARLSAALKSGASSTRPAKGR